jgi:type IV pilus assembly protein PilA
MVVVAIIGVLAAMAVYGVRSYILNARSTEARSVLSRIAKDATTAYQKPKSAGGVINLGSVSEDHVALCSSADAVPSDPAKIRAAKYQSSPAEWGGSTVAGWTCLNFSMEDPQYFQYDYNATGVSDEGDSFETIGRGDLDGDGNYSTFRITANIQRDGDGMVLIVAPGIEEIDPLE